ncbi:MAG: redoxin domain-containing protein [Pirellulaceae bacterium]|nr:redoxin domain-containing protein [Pirellulaceae bacterium]
MRPLVLLVLSVSLFIVPGIQRKLLAADQQSDTLADFQLVDHRGKDWQLDDFADDSVLAIAFLGTECPLAKLYAVRLNQIAADFRSRGVRVVAVMSNRQDSLEEIAAFVDRQNIGFPVLKDAGNSFADSIAAERTPEIFVYDKARKLRYRGRVDDQYGIGYVRDQPRRKDLRIALDELTSGQDVSIAQTKAVGCIIGRTKPTDDQSQVTFGSHVADILNRRCVECHREGEIAPFSLTDYDEVAGWSDMIAEVVREGRMPPWHATDDGAQFANDRSMTEDEKETLYAWADAGAPAGDLSNLPKAAGTLAGWQLPREPDRIIPVSPEPFHVPAAGEVRYQYFKFDPGLKEDVWLESAQLKPGNRAVVHHILAFAAPAGNTRGINGARGFLVGYVPGQRVEQWPAGHAKKIPAGSELIFQVHYTPIGTPQVDQSTLGLCFADPESITHEVVTTSAVQSRLNIPPGDSDWTTTATSPRFPQDARLLSMSPHMHVRGKAFKYELQYESGSTTLLDIPQYDFNWQTNYQLAKPMNVAAGSRFLCTAVFDNSEANLNNPDPTATVRWGDQTWDEMMIGYFNYAVPTTATSQPAHPQILARSPETAARLKKFDELDRDGDGKITRSDTPLKLIAIFNALDKNKDGVLEREEVQQAK